MLPFRLSAHATPQERDRASPYPRNWSGTFGRWLLLLLIVLGSLAPVQAGQRILVVTSAETPAQTEAVNALQARLREGERGRAVEIRPWDQTSADQTGVADIVVTVGTPAARTVASHANPAPVLHILLSAHNYASLPARANGRQSAIVLDQPPSRLIALVQLALPTLQRIALIGGSQSEEIVPPLARAASDARLGVAQASITRENELFGALQSVLSEPAVLIATPDPTVFNRFTVQNILLTAFRHRSPVLGFSAAYAKAGALLSLYSTPAQIGADAARVVESVLRGGNLPAASGPRSFEVQTNPTVARSLGIELPPAETLAARLRSLEEATP